MDPTIRFIYLMGQNQNDQVFFYGDSEPVRSPDESPTGQLYAEADEVIHSNFDTPETKVIGPITDRLGTWVTALVPYVDPKSGQVIALQGIDIDAKHWHRDVLMASLVPVLSLVCSLIFMVLLGAFLLRRRFNKPSSRQAKPPRLEFGLTIGVGLILTLFAAYLTYGEQQRDRSYLFRQLANSHTKSLADVLNNIGKRDLRIFRSLLRWQRHDS